MTTTQIWVLILGGMAITYSIRALFILVIRPDRLPEQVKTALQFVPPAVLAALIFPEVFLEQGQLNIALSNSRLIAALAASIIAWRTKNTWMTILAGMLVLGLLTGWGN